MDFSKKPRDNKKLLFKYENSIDLIEYFPDLNNIDILDTTDIDISIIQRIVKNPFLKFINFYIIDYKNKNILLKSLKKIMEKNINITFSFYSANSFFKEINFQKLQELSITNSLKYEVLWNEKTKFQNEFVFPIRLLRDIKNYHANEIGGYVSSLFNLSQLNNS